ncbi:MAG: hypothetical protein MUC81_13685 [Bacteroidia bacterium]|nr:hypothetical protein [Bacteroidia bacterium]
MTRKMTNIISYTSIVTYICGMKWQKIFCLVLITVVLSCVANELQAQGCPMCKTSLEEARKNGSMVGNTLNDGILYLLALPYIIVGTLGFIWYKKTRAAKKSTSAI